jgi:hypothetical protein
MSLCPSLRLPILLCVGLLLTGAVNPESAQFSRPIAVTPAIPVTEDPGATALLDSAIRALDPQRVPWMQLHLWQRVQLPQLVYQSEGLYRSGPGRRARLDLTVHVRGTEGRMLTVCDGTTFWQTEQVGSAPRTAFKVELKEFASALGDPEKEPQAIDEFFQTQSFVGLLPMLNGLRKEVRFTRRDRVRYRGQRMIRLIGVAARPAGPEALLRQCRLFLDEQTLWPCRVEWWGPAPRRGDDVVLMQMEFRNPQLHVLEDAFTFDPGPEKVEDRTAEWVENAKGLKGS